MAYSNGLVLTHLNDARTASANQPGMPAGQLRGYDRLKKTTDAVGGTVERVYDPANNVIRVEQRGTIGGASPTDRTGSANQLLTGTFEYFDELSRQYETQRDVFLPTGATLGERNGVRSVSGAV
jgi:hypothetical protein